MPITTWGPAPFIIHHSNGTDTRIVVKGRKRWALENLMAAGAKGCTPISHPGPRWAAYVCELTNKFGVEIDPVLERHDGPFPGNHVRYVLLSRISRADLKGGAA